ncbi:RPM1-interacting protein [Actinidia chinensis var. chinensis]|uniref:RPM1-interacting protein n=1 Tax=Actinidia chinensis var. chinensis TaxID=1590841 RepID=A0A2R6RB61_ACTCC|nr:RPM1-interacting protein [Actinidia chinensis var. chinensis]
MNPQQKRSHVPKFGSWDSDNIPYTAYFENARKEKGSGVMMNPNDPEENPEAFMFGRVGTGSECHRRNTSDHQKSGSHKSTNSESGSDKSNSGYALQQQNHRRTRSTTRKNSTTEANNFVRPSPAHDRLRSANNPSEDKSYRSVSVPKFGVWDEKDPKSGEGFTVIFNKVKEEKQIAATKLPTVPPQPRNFEKSQKKHAGSKICCCLFGGCSTYFLQKGSSVIFISSVAGYQPLASMAMYGMTKTTLLGFAKRSIEEQTMLNRLGTTEDMAAATVFLASDDDSFLINNNILKSRLICCMWQLALHTHPMWQLALHTHPMMLLNRRNSGCCWRNPF